MLSSWAAVPSSRAVVDKDQLVAQGQRAQHGVELGMQRTDVLHLVVNRNQHGKIQARRRLAGRRGIPGAWLFLPASVDGVLMPLFFSHACKVANYPLMNCSRCRLLMISESSRDSIAPSNARSSTSMATWPGVSRIAEGPEEGSPADVAQAGDLGSVPELGIGQDAVLIERGAVDPCVLGVNMEDSVPELGKRGQVIHLLPDHVRRVEVQAEMGAGDVVEHPPPDRRGRGQVLAAGPFVLGEEHRAVLDADP